MSREIIEFDPIRIRYDGIDAEEHKIDLAEFGKSAIGISKILATVAQFSVTGNYKKSRKRSDFRVLVGGAEDNCITFEAIIKSIDNHDFAQALLALGSVVLWDILKGTMKLFWKLVAGKPKEETKEYSDFLDLLKMHFKNDDKKIYKLITIVEKMSDDLREAAIQATNPIDVSCHTIQFGDVTNNYFVKLDVEDKEAIRTQNFEFSELESHNVLVSELDMKNATCMVSLKDNLKDRFKATITDPIIELANNPYGLAMNSKMIVQVSAKRKIHNGLTKEFIISNIDISNVPLLSIGPYQRYTQESLLDSTQEENTSNQ